MTGLLLASSVLFPLLLAACCLAARFRARAIAVLVVAPWPALLSALIGIWTFVDGQAIGMDARVPGVLAALVALLLRAPFLVVIVTAAAVTAAVRALGWLP